MYILSIIDSTEREVQISNYVNFSKKVQSVFLQNRQIDIPVIRIPNEMLIYRMNNGRTSVEQHEYIVINEHDAAFFFSGQENESAQIAQHNILLNMSKDAKGNIYAELQKVRMQTETLLITSSGVVVNGNRRLAAMRDLFYKEPDMFREFNHIDVAVLPSETTEDDLEILETELQLAPETKLEYGWIERRLKLRYQLEDRKIERKILKEKYRMKKEEDINVELHQLSLAEEYLENFLKKPRCYKDVSSSEYMFKELQKALVGRTGTEAELRRLIGFTLIKESRNLGDRAFKFKEIFGKQFDNVIVKFLAEEEVHLSEQENNTESEKDILDEIADNDNNTTYTPLVQMLSNSDESATLSTKFINAYESVKAEENEDTRKQLPLKNTIEALRLLNNIDISIAEPKTFYQIQGQLNSIEDVVDKLKEALKTCLQREV